MEDKLLVFVLGAPGAGKGTQCELVRKEFGWSHISAGDLLRAQVAAGTDVGKEAETIMKEGKLVPSSMIIGLLKDAISSSVHTKVLIDGFPRVLDQLGHFEEQVRPCTAAFFYKVSDSTAMERLSKRAESSGRVDDNDDTVQKRFVVFEQESMPVVDALRTDGRLVEIDATALPEVVFESTKQAIQRLQEQQLQRQLTAASDNTTAAIPEANTLAASLLSATNDAPVDASSLGSTRQTSAGAVAPDSTAAAAAKPEPEASSLSAATSAVEAGEASEPAAAQQPGEDVSVPATVSITGAAAVPAGDSQHMVAAADASAPDPSGVLAAVAALNISRSEEQGSTSAQVPADATAEQLQAGSEAAEAHVETSAMQEPAVVDVNKQQIDLSSIHTPFVICGPSGVGKGTLISRLMTQYSDKFGFSVSHTTRAPRPGEQHGVHYNFTDIPSMKQQVAAGLFLEHAEVHGNMYGTSLAAVAQVSSRGKHCVLDIDVQGARQVKASAVGPLCVFIFIAPPSHEELERRLRNRGTETEEKVLQRLANAESEIMQGQEPGLFDHILVNGDLESAYHQLQQLINQAVPGLLPDLATVSPTQSVQAAQIAEAPAASNSSSTATLATPTEAQNAASMPQVSMANGCTVPNQQSPAAAAAAAAASTGTSTLLDFGFGASAGPAVAVKGMPVRQYMDVTVIPVLREGLKALNTARPDDPLQFLADFLVAHKPAPH